MFYLFFALHLYTNTELSMDVCMCPLQLELLCAASQHGDKESVRFLLKDARVPFSQETTEGNPAILAAHYGHCSVVQELLNSIPCKWRLNCPVSFDQILMTSNCQVMSWNDPSCSQNNNNVCPVIYLCHRGRKKNGLMW